LEIEVASPNKKIGEIAFCSGLQRELDMRQHKTTIISSH
jgi:hypothetical protein